MKHAGNEKIIATVKACPSGAISIKTSQPPKMETENPENQGSKINIISNGPVRVLGPCFITLPDGTVVEKLNGVSFCRCGLSTTKPFCDGSHKSNGFAG